MDRLLRAALSHVRRGNLRVTSAARATYQLVDGRGPPVAVRFTLPAAQLMVLLNPDLKLGEAYMDGTFAVDSGTIADFVDLVMQESEKPAWPRWAAVFATLRFAGRRLAQFNLRSQARRNVAHHYDLDGPALLAVSRQRPAIQLRLFRERQPVA